jgi:hypothetical protein
MEVIKITELEDFRKLTYEIRDLSIGGAMYAANISSDEKDAPFNLAMYDVISRNADIVLRLFDIIEYMPEVKEKIRMGLFNTGRFLL